MSWNVSEEYFVVFLNTLGYTAFLFECEYTVYTYIE